MDEIASKLLEELSCDTVFTIPLFGGIAVLESTVVTWIIMAAMTILAILLVRGLRVDHPDKKQLMLEVAAGWVENFFGNIMCRKGRRYIPFLTTVMLYIAIANLIGILGFKPPTKDMNVTAGLALISIVMIEYSGYHARGFKGKLASFAEPNPVILPINLMEVVIRPVSLCMRLFGNVLGSFVVMELLKLVMPVLLPIPFSFYFDVFDGLIQAYVFVFLTALFINEAVETA